MINEAAFLAAIKAAPGDNLARLAYADWLDEQGRPEGQFLRIECQLSALDPSDASRAELKAKFLLASRGIDSGWIEVVSRVPIEEVNGGIRCEYCHKHVAAADHPSHRARHEERLADGQQRDYLSLPPEERHQGSLAGVPRIYVHLGCGGRTVMQESIIRSYLKDPFLYGPYNFCTGCGAHVHDRECVWAETGENLHTYMKRLRASSSPGLRGMLRCLLANIRDLFA
jgi:uncharacterized protein (TIGR02996 family)